jgi:predicted ATP-grasp superfamily ATP-dependent carboligase
LTRQHKEKWQRHIKWTTENKCKLIISAQGIISSSSSHHSRSGNGNKDFGHEDSNYEDNNNTDTAKSTTPAPLTPLPADIYAVTSTEAALRVGTVTGIPAIMLNEGALTDLDVIVFLVNVLRDVPDFRAAAIVSEAINRIVPNLSCDTDGLMVEAQIIEKRMKNVRAEQKRISYIA